MNNTLQRIDEAPNATKSKDGIMSVCLPQLTELDTAHKIKLQHFKTSLKMLKSTLISSSLGNTVLLI